MSAKTKAAVKQKNLNCEMEKEDVKKAKKKLWTVKECPFQRQRKLNSLSFSSIFCCFVSESYFCNLSNFDVSRYTSNRTKPHCRFDLLEINIDFFRLLDLNRKTLILYIQSLWIDGASGSLILFHDIIWFNKFYIRFEESTSHKNVMRSHHIRSSNNRPNQK